MILWLQYKTAMNNISCLVDNQFVSSYTGQQMSKIMASLPSSTNELLAMLVAGQINQNNDLISGTAIATQALTSLSPSDVKTATHPAKAIRAIVTVFENNIIFRFDANPAANLGFVGAKNANFEISLNFPFRFVSQSGQASIFITYY